ncbi:MAG: magnesium transporter [Lachnospiraceae bacterium]|nr:magnesium transporter [Lachnospiraceae bacterium]
MNVKKNIGIATTTQHPDYKHEIITMIRSNLTPKLIKEKIGEYHENDIAAAIDLLKKDERHKLYSVLDTQTLADILEYSEQRNNYIDEMGIRKRVDILSCLEVTTAVEYLHQLDKRQRSMLIDLLEDDLKKEIALSSSFDKDEIGSRMTTNYISIHAEIGVRQAMKELVQQAADNDNISTIYVLDDDSTLLGAIDLKDLIIARESTSLDSIIMTSYPYVYANELIEECIERIQDYSEDSIPVLDENNRLTGVLTAQDIVQLVNDILGEDYAKLAGLSSEEDLQEPLKKSIGKRLPWLVILLGLGMVVSSVVGLFETVVAHLTLIVCFQSLVLDMAGNVGTQSLAVTIRVLMDEHLDGKQKLFLISKEARVGLLNGLILGVLSFAFIGLYLLLLKGQSVLMAFSISACTGIALLVSMVLSSIAGTAIPILLKKIKIDPAVASGPLITTINDLVAVVSYYGLAWILLIHILHV